MRRSAARSLPLLTCCLCAFAIWFAGAPQHASGSRWKTLETTHFRVHYLGEGRALARRVGVSAEQQLKKHAARLQAPDEALVWDGLCDVYLYPSHLDLIRMTGGDAKAGSSSSRASRLYHGRILSRRINVAASDPNLLTATLPHEVTHIIVGALMGGDAPRWANEGLAVSSEPRSAQARFDRLVARAYHGGRLIAVSHLMALQDYPIDGYKLLFYAQSMSLTRYLVKQKGAYQFVLFLQIAKMYDYERALRAVYDIAGFSDLERRWRRDLAQRDSSRYRAHHQHGGPVPVHHH